MSISAILAKAFSTTLLGMGTVFALLIVISLIIGWLRYIPAVLDRLQKPKSTAAAPAASAASDAAGGMQAASDAGLTGIYYVAAADGAKEAYDYIKGDKTTESGEYYCTGENSPVQVAIKAVGIAKEILVDGKDMNSYDEVTLTDAVCVTKDNVDERYEYGF